MRNKLALLALVLGGTLGVVLTYHILKVCSRRAKLAGRKFFDGCSIVSILLYTLPMLHLTLGEEDLLPLTLSHTQFILLLCICFTLASTLNIIRWGIGYGVLFGVCHLLFAGLICLTALMLIFGIFLLFAILAPMNSKTGGFWIGVTMFGDEFLVMPIGNDLYQDGDLHTYTMLDKDTMLGSDGRIYYIHRVA